LLFRQFDQGSAETYATSVSYLHQHFPSSSKNVFEDCYKTTKVKIFSDWSDDCWKSR